MKWHSFKLCDSYKQIFKCCQISARKYSICFTELNAKTLFHKIIIYDTPSVSKWMIFSKIRCWGAWSPAWNHPTLKIWRPSWYADIVPVVIKRSTMGCPIQFQQENFSCLGNVIFFSILVNKYMIQHIPVDCFIIKNREDLSFAYIVQCRNGIASSKCVSKEDVIPDVDMTSCICISWLQNIVGGWRLNCMYISTKRIALSFSMTSRSVSLPARTIGLSRSFAAANAVLLIIWSASAGLWLHTNPIFSNFVITCPINMINRALLRRLARKRFCFHGFHVSI